MAQYRASSDLFVDNRLIDSGSEFTSDGVPGYHWVPLDEEAKARVSERNAVESTATNVTNDDDRDDDRDDDKVYADGEPENIDGKLYATVDGLQFEVTRSNVRDDLSLTAGGIEKYEAAKKA